LGAWGLNLPGEGGGGGGGEVECSSFHIR